MLPWFSSHRLCHYFITTASPLFTSGKTATAGWYKNISTDPAQKWFITVYSEIDMLLIGLSALCGLIWMHVYFISKTCWSSSPGSPGTVCNTQPWSYALSHWLCCFLSLLYNHNKYAKAHPSLTKKGMLKKVLHCKIYTKSALRAVYRWLSFFCFPVCSCFVYVCKSCFSPATESGWVVSLESGLRSMMEKSGKGSVKREWGSVNKWNHNTASQNKLSVSTAITIHCLFSLTTTALAVTHWAAV